MNDTPSSPNEYLVVDDTKYSTLHTTKFRRRSRYTPKDPKKLLAFIPGIIRVISVRPGQKVSRGQSLLILEAMKMKNDVTAPLDGTVRTVNVAVGDMVTKNHLLIEFE